MLLELLLSRLPLHRLIAVRLRQLNLHGLAIHLEPIHLLHGLQRRLLTVEHNESLALALQAGFSDDVDDGPIVRENGRERLLERIDLDAFLEVVDLRRLVEHRATRVQCSACWENMWDLHRRYMGSLASATVM